jgi:hypothetical protein
MRKRVPVIVRLPDGSEKQITVDFEDGAIVEGVLADGTYDTHPQSEPDCVITVKNGRAKVA